VVDEPAGKTSGRNRPEDRLGMSIGVLLIRADAGPRVGVGHLMRCLALAEAWRQRDGEVVIVAGDLPDGLAERMASVGASSRIVSAQQDSGGWLGETAAAQDAAWIVIDGYGFGPDYMAAAGQSDRPVLMIDDDARHDGYPVQALLNQNLHARAENYADKTDAALMLGPRHALIRGALSAWKDWVRGMPVRANRILVTLGGADLGGHTAKVIAALAVLQQRAPDLDLQARVAVGGANPRLNALREAAADHNGIKILFDIKDMERQISWCDIALSASGSTVWELALFQTPMLLATAAPVEEPVAASLADAGAALVLGRLEDQNAAAIAAGRLALADDPARRASLADAAARLVDGNGAARVVEQMLAISNARG
jgi:UDP-2,4-diacetamido-2,4,6-trideoxy-beta-L-altropyranose hydrolase